MEEQLILNLSSRNIESYKGEKTINLVSNGDFSRNELPSNLTFSASVETVIEDCPKDINDFTPSKRAVKITKISNLDDKIFSFSDDLTNKGRENKYTFSCWIFVPTNSSLETSSLNGLIFPKWNPESLDKSQTDKRLEILSEYQKGYWKRFSFRWFALEDGFSHALSFLENESQNSYFYITNIQIESKEYATPFVNGERNAPLVDISGFDNEVIFNNDTSTGKSHFAFSVNGVTSIFPEESKRYLNFNTGDNLSQTIEIPAKNNDNDDFIWLPSQERNLRVEFWARMKESDSEEFTLLEKKASTFHEGFNWKITNKNFFISAGEKKHTFDFYNLGSGFKLDDNQWNNFIVLSSRGFIYLYLNGERKDKWKFDTNFNFNDSTKGNSLIFSANKECKLSSLKVYKQEPTNENFIDSELKKSYQIESQNFPIDSELGWPVEYIDSSDLGEYVITYNVEDSSSNKAVEQRRIVKVTDKDKPFIYLNGPDYYKVKKGFPFNNITTAIAKDSFDGDITSSIKINKEAVDTENVGIYSITYNVTDSSGNQADQKTVTVEVEEVYPPILTINEKTAYVDSGNLYKDTEGVTFSATSHDRTVDLTWSVSIKKREINNDSSVVYTDVKNEVLGNGYVGASPGNAFTLTYSVVDQNQTVEKVRRIVVNPDLKEPEITLVNDEDLFLFVDETYEEDGVSAGIEKGTDNYGFVEDGSQKEINFQNNALSDKFIIKVERKKDGSFEDVTNEVLQRSETKASYSFGIAGIYKVSYSVQDFYGNTSPIIEKNVTVSNTTPPNITLNGSDLILYVNEQGTVSYVEPGATATDYRGQTLTFNQDATDFKISDENGFIFERAIPNSHIAAPDLGDFPVTYTATCSSDSNLKEIITRKLTIKDEISPSFLDSNDNTVTSYPLETVEFGDFYEDKGVRAKDNYGFVNDNDSTRYKKIDIETSQHQNFFKKKLIRLDENNSEISSTSFVSKWENVPSTSFSNLNIHSVENGKILLEEGYYEIKYKIEDGAQNEAEITRRVEVEDTTSPTIKLEGNSEITLFLNSINDYQEEGVTLKDKGRVTQENKTTAGDYDWANLSITSTVRNQIGEYIRTYTLTDPKNQQATVDRKIVVRDNTAPTIILSGDKIITVNLGETFNDPGATVVDDSVPDNSENPIEATVSGSVNTAVLGTYILTYNAVDDTGNSADPVIRTVIVKDINPPKITLIGDNPAQVELGDDYVDAGVEVKDDDGNTYVPELNIDLTHDDYKKPKKDFTITYTVKDSSDNEATITRRVEVKDTIAPSIEFKNGNQLEMNYDQEKVPPLTVEVTDKGDKHINSKPTVFYGSLLKESNSSWEKDYFPVGRHTKNYTAIDSARNESKKQFEIIVKDPYRPTIDFSSVDKIQEISNKTIVNNDDYYKFEDNLILFQENYGYKSKNEDLIATSNNLSFTAKQVARTEIYYKDNLAAKTKVKVFERYPVDVEIKGEPNIKTQNDEYVKLQDTETDYYYKFYKRGYYEIVYYTEDYAGNSLDDSDSNEILNYNGESFEKPKNSIILIVGNFTPPTITLKGGEDPIEHELGAEFKDPKATVKDFEGTTVKDDLEADNSNDISDKNHGDTVVLAYNYTLDGLKAKTVYRDVFILDREGPEIKLVGQAPHYNEVNGPIEGFTFYNQEEGKKYLKVRFPDIKYKDASALKLLLGDSYSANTIHTFTFKDDFGIGAEYMVEGTVRSFFDLQYIDSDNNTQTVWGSVDSDEGSGNVFNFPLDRISDDASDNVNSKEFIYKVLDTHGNETILPLEVVIKNGISPIINLNDYFYSDGSKAEDPSIIFLDLDSPSYIEPGATAFDYKGDSINVSVVGANNVDTSAGGVYEIKYTAEDDTGLKTEIIRTVTVTVKDIDIHASDFRITSINSNNEILFYKMRYETHGLTFKDNISYHSNESSQSPWRPWPPKDHYRAASFEKKSGNDNSLGKWIPNSNFWGVITDYYSPSSYDPYDKNVSYNQINYNFAGVGYSSWFYETANSEENHVYEAEEHLKKITGTPSLTNKSLVDFYKDETLASSSYHFDGTFSPNYGKRYAPFVMISERCCLFLGALGPEQTHACFSGPLTKYSPKSIAEVDVDYQSNEPQDIKAFEIVKSQEIRLASLHTVTLCQLDMKNSSFIPETYPIVILEESFFTVRNSLYEDYNLLFRLPIYLVGIDNLFSANFTMNVNMAEVRMTRKFLYGGREVNEVFYLNSPWPSLKSSEYEHSLFYGLNSFIHKKYSSIGGNPRDFVSELNDLAFCSFRDGDNQGHLALLSSSPCTSYSSVLYDKYRNRDNNHYTTNLRETHVWNRELTKNRNYGFKSFSDKETIEFYRRWKIYSGDLDDSYRYHKNLEDLNAFPSTNNVTLEILYSEEDKKSVTNFSSGSFKAFTKKDKDSIIEAYNNLGLHPEKPQFVNISPSG